MSAALLAGAAVADITPIDSQFLFGYPHVARYSTGIHDPLLSSALYLSDGKTQLLLIANDVIYVSKVSTHRVREQIGRATGITADHIMVSATHSHSGPLTVDTLSNEGDPIVPKTDPAYVALFEQGIIQAGIQAFRDARPAEIGFATADGSCVGGNRHDPAGPADPQVPVVVVRDRVTREYLAAMLVCSMHPTVLHEDTTLITGDFPAMTRQYLQEHVFGKNCPVLHHTGPCGDQSPRHVTRSNTFDEATRLGYLLGQSLASAIASMQYADDIVLGCFHATVELPPRGFVSVSTAQSQVSAALEHLESLRRNQADRREIRTAECDWFGSEETLALAKAAAEGRILPAIAGVMPAEIQCMKLGQWSFIAWPGESFVEFALHVKNAYNYCSIISMANGELQGYIVTDEAMQKKWYEAMNSLFASPQSGNLLVAKTLELLESQGALTCQRSSPSI